MQSFPVVFGQQFGANFMQRILTFDYDPWPLHPSPPVVANCLLQTADQQRRTETSQTALADLQLAKFDTHMKQSPSIRISHKW